MVDIKQYETNLEWKNHNDFFRNLNEFIKEISEVEILIYADAMQVYKYYAMISALYSKHNCYITNCASVETQLKNIRKGLYDSNILKMIEKRPNDKMVIAHLIKIYDALVDLYRKFIRDFTENELLPKVMKYEKQIGAVRVG